MTEPILETIRALKRTYTFTHPKVGVVGVGGDDLLVPNTVRALKTMHSSLTQRSKL